MWHLSGPIMVWKETTMSHWDIRMQPQHCRLITFSFCTSLKGFYFYDFNLKGIEYSYRTTDYLVTTLEWSTGHSGPEIHSLNIKGFKGRTTRSALTHLWSRHCLQKTLWMSRETRGRPSVCRDVLTPNVEWIYHVINPWKRSMRRLGVEWNSFPCVGWDWLTC